ncbi:MAG: hypothetical protein JWP81_4399 [Ferruginibacter sp.]|nr:hypothetical protein [Ferruginibacter sp.]
MKKMILAATLVIGLLSFSNAQTVKPAPAKPKKVTEVKATTQVAPAAQPVKTTTAKAAKPVVAPAKAVNAQGVVLKKDGTPDKRYSAATAKPKGPVKKDGTADLRFKSNKKSK